MYKRHFIANVTYYKPFYQFICIICLHYDKRLKCYPDVIFLPGDSQDSQLVCLSVLSPGQEAGSDQQSETVKRLTLSPTPRAL